MNEYERRLQKSARDSCDCRKKASSAVDPTADSDLVSPTPRLSPTNMLSFVTVDVFTTTPFRGNQLAIIRVSPNLDLSHEAKQKIAREFNFSEAGFLHEPSGPHKVRRLDIFTVSQELPFAGHPTVGAACYVFQNLESDTDQTTMSCKAGFITCNYDRKENLAKIEIPHRHHIHSQSVSGRSILRTQTYLARTSVVTSEFPVVSIVKGMSFVLVNLPSVVPQLERLEAGAGSVDTSAVKLDQGWEPSFVGCYFYVATSQPGQTMQKLRTRMLESKFGEDAATGSAACTLACYLALRDGRMGKTYQYVIEQGVEMDRASEIHVEVALDAEGKVQSVRRSLGLLSSMHTFVCDQ